MITPVNQPPSFSNGRRTSGDRPPDSFHNMIGIQRPPPSIVSSNRLYQSTHQNMHWSGLWDADSHHRPAPCALIYPCELKGELPFWKPLIQHEKSLHAHSKRLLREGRCRADERLVGLTRIDLSPIPPPSGKKPRRTMLPDAIETDSPLLSRSLEQN